jgi:hypothetical protein
VDAATGIITTLVGPLPDRPNGVLAASDGNIYFVTDTGRLYKHDGTSITNISVEANTALYSLDIHPLTRVLYTVASFGLYNVSFLVGAEPVAALATRTPTNDAVGIAFNSSGDAFIAGFSSGRIYKWSGSGVPAVLNTGNSAPSNGAAAVDVQFGAPYGLAIDGAGNMLISETRSRCQVWLVEAQTGKLRLVAGDGTCQSGSALDPSDPTKSPLYSPLGVAFGLGDRAVLIADDSSHRVFKVMLECVGA